MYIIFDCDGVLIDSNQLKTEAFRNILKSYPAEAVEAFIDHHRRNGGVSRYVKLQSFLTETIGRDDHKEELEYLLEQFGLESARLYQKAAITLGTLDALEHFKERLPMFVASGSDEEELRAALEKRGLSKYFQAIYGSPKPKHECVGLIFEQMEKNTDGIMVGDAITDYKAAEALGLKFVFVSSYSESVEMMVSLAKEKGFPCINNLSELPQLIEEGLE